jgi:predicted transcriptional regulator
MSQKELAMEVLAKMPDHCTFDQIMEELRFLAAVREGMEDLDKGLEIDHAEVKKKLASWLAT